jgi:hypothetical protein
MATMVMVWRGVEVTARAPPGSRRVPWLTVSPPLKVWVAMAVWRNPEDGVEEPKRLDRSHWIKERIKARILLPPTIFSCFVASLALG